MDNDPKLERENSRPGRSPENVQVATIVQRVGSHTGLLIKLAFFYPTKEASKTG